MIELLKFYVTVANRKYNLLNHDYEIVIQQYSQLNVIDDITTISVQPTFQFHSLGEMEFLKIDCLYGWFLFVVFCIDIYWHIVCFLTDAIGIIKSVGALSIVYERSTHKPLDIIRLLLCDATGNVEVHLWNDMVRIYIVLGAMIFFIICTNAMLIFHFII